MGALVKVGIAFGVIILIILIIVIVLAVYYSLKSEPEVVVTDVLLDNDGNVLAAEQKVIKPRQNPSDKGHANRKRGWFDVQDQGVKNDYCRWVGDSPNTWFSCALAGAESQYTPKGVYAEDMSYFA